MMRASLHQVANWLNNQSRPLPDIAIQGVSTDTRTLVSGNLFVALKGERFDGHDHLPAALAAGAAAAVVARLNPQIDIPQILVDDTLAALQTLGKCWRDQVDPFVIAITGSAGKTTVKQLLAAMCAQVGATRATVGNLNNDIGVPLTLLSLDLTDRFAVIEMGANHVGEIARLTALARPDVALVTMAGTAHVGEFGSIDAIVQAKGELYAGLAPDAKAVINLDSYGADRWWAHCPAHRSGFSSAGDGRARWAGEYDTATSRLSVFEDGQPMLSELALPLPGAHNATNLLAAIAVARASGLSLEAITKGLREFTPPPGRMSLVRCSDQLTVINDTYNANPESMRAALDYLVSLPGRHVAILGDMGELGDQTDELHESLIRYAQTLSLYGLFTLGEAMNKAITSTRPEPANALVLAADEPEIIAEKLMPLLDRVERDSSAKMPVTVLVKGSRFMRMERMMNWLVPTHPESEAH
ncbi:MAG: UDP-N-acetylmuramoyl-tripeptide--D-alanyl-D-alanine ligase [Halothiobacillus sp.]|jgi:UDP-N-acetylmuramoyl-tripeptide--D-alanyl-D-alanine ligase|nr:UDP-N-acetylmuramoyl-tripeptide--D-alanyl-D-alanine ligase [Halothiobacillus sp.]